jgi:hypothetical protein
MTVHRIVNACQRNALIHVLMVETFVQSLLGVEVSTIEVNAIVQSELKEIHKFLVSLLAASQITTAAKMRAVTL